MNGIVDLLKEAGKAKGDRTAANKNRKSAENDRKARLAMINSMDFEPMYASQTTPTFKRTESPVARAYLESFLMGNNGDATFSGAPNSAAMKDAQQRAQNQTFGTPQERAARQQQILQETPWAVQAPTRQVTAGSQEAQWAAGNPKLAGKGYSQGEADALFDPNTNKNAANYAMLSSWLGLDKDKLQELEAKRAAKGKK